MGRAFCKSLWVDFMESSRAFDEPTIRGLKKNQFIIILSDGVTLISQKDWEGIVANMEDHEDGNLDSWLDVYLSEVQRL